MVILLGKGHGNRILRTHIAQVGMWLHEKLRAPVEYISGNHDPYWDRPAVFVDEIRPWLRRFSR
jgi:hypothetical protein